MKFGEGPDGNPRTRGLLVRRFTGDSTPWTFPVRPVKLVKEWPEKPPFKPENFLRADQQDDGSFYAVPRFVYHIDESAVATCDLGRSRQSAQAKNNDSLETDSVTGN
jgi:hypothetical protein